MRVVDVAELPWPHHPYKCFFHREFEAAISPDIPWGDRPRAIGRVACSLSASQLSECQYHRTDWEWAAETAIAYWQSRDGETLGEVASRGRAEGHSRQTVEGLLSFFAEPIFINGQTLGNGQHRVCAMKLGGIARCLIEA